MTEPFRIFDVHVSDVAPLSDSFLRVTFTGDDLDLLADNGFDQRIKLILPLPGRGVSGMPRGADWFTRWRALPDEARNPLRTYTVRAVRPGLREVDVDIVLHGDGGPAARWPTARDRVTVSRCSAPTPGTASGTAGWSSGRRRTRAGSCWRATRPRCPPSPPSWSGCPRAARGGAAGGAVPGRRAAVRDQERRHRHLAARGGGQAAAGWCPR